MKVLLVFAALWAGVFSDSVPGPGGWCPPTQGTLKASTEGTYHKLPYTASGSIPFYDIITAVGTVVSSSSTTELRNILLDTTYDGVSLDTFSWSLGRAAFGIRVNEGLAVSDGPNKLPQFDFYAADGSWLVSIVLYYDTSTRLLDVGVVGECAGADYRTQQIDVTSSTGGISTSPAYGVGLEIFQDETTETPSRRLRIYLKNNGNEFAYTDSEGHVTPEPIPEACITAMADTAALIHPGTDNVEYTLNSLDSKATPTAGQIAIHPATGATIFADFNDALTDDSPTPVLRFEESNCVNIENYQWQALEITLEVCPASADDLVPCPHIILDEGQTPLEELCDVTSCCFYADAGDGDKCVANPSFVCEVSEQFVIDTQSVSSTTAYTIGSTTLSITDRTIALGQSLTIQCLGDNWISAEGSIDTTVYSDDPQVATFQCIISSQGTPDFDRIVSTVKCREPCGMPTVVETIVMDPFFVSNPDGKIPYGNHITLSCADGYGKENGDTSASEFECRSDQTYDLKCYQCVVTPPTGENQFTYSSDTSLINTPITKICNEGYSFTNGGTTHDLDCNLGFDAVIGVNVARLSEAAVGFEDCTKDCRIVVDDDHGLDPAPPEYLAQTFDFTVNCAAGRALSETDKNNNNFVCMDGNDINVPRCENECDLTTTLETYRLLTETGTFYTDASMRSGKTYTLLCKQTGYAFLPTVHEDLKQITCTDGVLSTPPDCYGKCSINDLTTYHNELTVDDIVDEGLGDAATEDEKTSYASGYFTADLSLNRMRPATTIQVTCKDEKLAETDKTTSYEVTCGLDAAPVTLQRCYDTCASADLNQYVNTNTLIKAKDDHSSDLPEKVPYFTVIDHICQDGSYMMKSTAVTSVWKCGSGGGFRLNDGVTQDEADSAVCVAIPTLATEIPASTGYQTYQFKVTLPTDRDMTVNILSVEIQNEAGDLLEDISVDVASDHEYTVTRTVDVADDELKLGESLQVVGIIIELDPGVESVAITGSVTGPFYAGPPAVASDSITFSVVGQSVSLGWKDGFTTTWEGITGDNYVPVFSVQVHEGSDFLTAIYTAATLAELVAITSITEELKPLTEYTVSIATSTSHGIGASESFNFKTGHNKLVLEAVDSESPTERTVNIELGASSLAGEHQVKYTLTPGIHEAEQSVDITFAEASSVHNMDFTTLQPLTAYEFTATIFTTEGIPSETESVSFSTGPTPPPALEAAQITFTDTEFTIDLQDINAGYKYYVVVSKEVDSVWEVVSNQEFGPGADKKRDTTQTITFENLEPYTTYKVEVSTEGTVDGTAIRSLPQSIQFTTHACETTTLTETGVTVGLKDSDATPADHYSPDANVVFVLTCEDGKILDEKDPATNAYTESVTAQTTCTAEGWAAVTPCIEKAEASSSGLSTGAIIGIAVAGALVLLLLIILLLCICGCCRRSGGTTENGTSKNYSPRDNEKKEAEVPATELNAVVVEDQKEEEPDIPAKEASDSGSRHSVEAKIEMTDEPAAAEEAEQKV